MSSSASSCTSFKHITSKWCFVLLLAVHLTTVTSIRSSDSDNSTSANSLQFDSTSETKNYSTVVGGGKLNDAIKSAISDEMDQFKVEIDDNLRVFMIVLVTSLLCSTWVDREQDPGQYLLNMTDFFNEFDLIHELDSDELLDVFYTAPEKYLEQVKADKWPPCNFYKSPVRVPESLTPLFEDMFNKKRAWRGDGLILKYGEVMDRFVAAYDDYINHLEHKDHFHDDVFVFPRKAELLVTVRKRYHKVKDYIKKKEKPTEEAFFYGPSKLGETLKTRGKVLGVVGAAAMGGLGYHQLTKGRTTTQVPAANVTTNATVERYVIQDNSGSTSTAPDSLKKGPLLWIAIVVVGALVVIAVGMLVYKQFFHVQSDSDSDLTSNDSKNRKSRKPPVTEQDAAEKRTNSPSAEMQKRQEKAKSRTKSGTNSASSCAANSSPPNSAANKQHSNQISGAQSGFPRVSSTRRTRTTSNGSGVSMTKITN